MPSAEADPPAAEADLPSVEADLPAAEVYPPEADDVLRTQNQDVTASPGDCALKNTTTVPMTATIIPRISIVGTP